MVGRPKGTPKTGGRKKGTPNKISSALKEAILEAAEQAGGEHGTVGYLVVQAHANPAAFMSLLGKVLPMTITDTAQNEEIKFVIEERVVYPKDKDGNIIWPEWMLEQKPEDVVFRLEHSGKASALPELENSQGPKRG
jgi:hypothetical protein